MQDKRIRQLVIAVLVVLLVLGLLNIVSTAFSLLIPLAIAAAVAFAFYKIVLEGRDKPAAMEDEIAETAGAETGVEAESMVAPESDQDLDEESDAARKRLSAVQRAQTEFFETSSPAEEILEQIKSRKRRLQGNDET